MRDIKLSCAFQRIGCHHNIGRVRGLVLALGKLPDLIERLYAVHPGHHVIDKDDIVLFLADHPDALLAGARCVNGHFRLLEESPDNLKVHPVVIRNKDTRARCSKRRPVFAGHTVSSLAYVYDPDSLRVDDILIYDYRKLAAHALLALNAYVGIHETT